MASRFLLGLIIFHIFILAKGARACQEPHKGSHFVRENLEDDIVMSIVSNEPDVGSYWSVKGIVDDKSDSVLAESFTWNRDGPIWNLVVTRGIVLPAQDSRSVNLLKINMEIECVDKRNQRFVYPILINVLREDLLEKIPITVPENTPTQQPIYYDKEKHSNPPPTYKHHLLPDLDDASGFLELNRATGSVTLVNNLDYERDPKVMWFLVMKLFKSGKRKLRLFRIEIGNVNDNAPEFYRSDDCLEGRQCKVVSYSFTLDKMGVLKSENGNSIRAVDLDGDTIAYSIVQAMPQQDFITINEMTGELMANRPKSEVASRYVLTIKASDGFHRTEAAVIIHIEGDEPADSILELLEIGESDGEDVSKEQSTEKSLISALVAPSKADYEQGRLEVSTSKIVMDSSTEIPKLSSENPSGDNRHPGDIRRPTMKAVSTINGDRLKRLSIASRTVSTPRFEANSTDRFTTTTVTVDGLAAQDDEGEDLMYLLELCRNLTLILAQDTGTSAALLAAASNSSTVNVTIDDSFKNGTRNGVGDVMNWEELQDILGVTLLSPNGSEIGIDEANRTCIIGDWGSGKIMGHEYAAGTSAASSLVLGNTLVLVLCSLISFLCIGI